MGNIKSKFILGTFTALVGVFLLNHSAYATSYINVSSGSGGAISFGSVRPTSAGALAKASDTLTVNTNCNVGYSVYVSGQSGKDTNLTNSSASSNNTIAASSNAIGSAGSLSVNTWGLNYEDNGTYVGLPEYSETLPPALVTIPSSSETSTVDIYYGLKVNTALTPGTYTGDVLYTVISNPTCAIYTVRFNANGGTGIMSDQTINVGEATSLSANTFTRAGYMFLGWATSSSATAPTYKNGESVTDIANFNSTVDLYAVWGKSTGNMQDFQCTSLASGATTYLTDTRDNQVYSIYRIPVDQTYAGTSTIANVAGKCLMTKDLSLGYATGGSTTRGSNLVLSSSSSAGAGTIIARDSVSDWDTTDSLDNIQYINGPSTAGNAYSQHSYYSWGAAQIVCPRGWRLPEKGEYGNPPNNDIGLSAVVGNDVDGSVAIQSSPWNFILGGRVDKTQSWNYQGEYGFYWSSGYRSKTARYTLRFTPSSVDSYMFAISYGHSVRCIVQNRYAINYNVNGASGSPSKATEGVVYENDSVTMPTVGTMVKSGYEFKGWALTSGATSATYEPGASVSVSTLATATSASDGGTITLYAVWESTGPTVVGDCSDTVHPTSSQACKMKDNRTWVLGSTTSGTFNGLCTNQTNTNNHDATCSGCPSGYKFPKITDYDTLIKAYGGTSHSGNRSGYQETTGALYKVLGYSGGRGYWSSTEYDSGYAYRLYGDGGYSLSSSYDGKSGILYILCYK